MPIAIKDLAGGEGVLITGHGGLTDEEYLGAMRPHLMQPEDKLRRIRYSLSDYSGIRGASVSRNALELVAGFCEYAAEINPNVVVAVVTSEELAFGLSRMWELMTGEIPWETFSTRSRAEAEAWIKRRAELRFGIKKISFA